METLEDLLKKETAGMTPEQSAFFLKGWSKGYDRAIELFKQASKTEAL